MLQDHQAVDILLAEVDIYEIFAFKHCKGRRVKLALCEGTICLHFWILQAFFEERLSLQFSIQGMRSKCYSFTFWCWHICPPDIIVSELKERMHDLKSELQSYNSEESDERQKRKALDALKKMESWNLFSDTQEVD